MPPPTADVRPDQSTGPDPVPQEFIGGDPHNLNALAVPTDGPSVATRVGDQVLLGTSNAVRVAVARTPVQRSACEGGG